MNIVVGGSDSDNSWETNISGERGWTLHDEVSIYNNLQFSNGHGFTILTEFYFYSNGQLIKYHYDGHYWELIPIYGLQRPLLPLFPTSAVSVVDKKFYC